MPPVLLLPPATAATTNYTFLKHTHTLFFELLFVTIFLKRKRRTREKEELKKRES